MAPTNERPRLLSPYPGAKNPRLYPVHDGRQYDTWIAPFVGSGEQEAWLATRYPNVPVIAADADHMVRAVWKCWGDTARMDEVTALCSQWRDRVLASPQVTYSELVDAFNTASKRGASEALLTADAAVSIVLRRLVYGGTLRVNGDGYLNVSLSKDKLAKFFPDWEYRWPTPTQSLSVGDDWRYCIDTLAASDYTNAIAIVDPPYWAPGNSPRVKNGMTPAYVVHDPQATNTLALFIDCIAALLRTGKVSRIVAFNYWAEWGIDDAEPTEYPIDAMLKALCSEHGMPCHHANLGTLTTMHKGNGEAAIARYEAVWEIGGTRMYGNRPLIKPEREPQQLALI